MLTRTIKQMLPAILLPIAFLLTACSVSSPQAGTDTSIPSSASGESPEDTASDPRHPASSADSAVDFDHELADYQPKKDHYNFYFTYKTVHPWWDAVALGMEEAQRQFLDRGIQITYEYMAPEGASAEDQTMRLNEAATKNYDVIGVDVADEDVITPLLDEMVDAGQYCLYPVLHLYRTKQASFFK
ncbi:MAG: hypothetical protein K6E18_04385 [Lachnospiraceae bacterium]|nr:hypothetical protein [Lachnospiraceae bacterium]